MKLTEKMSYLKGLMDGLDIDSSTKEGRILNQMSELLEEIVVYVDDMQSQIDELTDICDSISDELYSVDDMECDGCDWTDDEDDDDYDFDGDDDELYEITCPTCGDTILIDEGMIEEGSMNCPNCDELLEFDYENLTIEDFETAETEDKDDE
ncbi:MAG: hypothetical protein NC205_07065 [Prevotella sp.]|nr:hypothetical protein [Alistipes senegalensis]MCM1358338.1 hypothetical protein [Prevotella sp.]MCM1473084.1 hypothetical protein [Muribaculaceae bacterium]